MQKIRDYWNSFRTTVEAFVALCDKELEEEEKRRQEIFAHLTMEQPGEKIIT